MNPTSVDGACIWVCGHNGMVGSALVRRLQREGSVVLTADRDTVDLRRQAQVERWVAQQRPDIVVVAAAVVGGLPANMAHPVAFLSDNLAIATNVIDAAASAGVERLLFLGSSCIYPRLAQQPMPEDALLTGPLEPTNQWYAIAKLAALKLAEAYHRERGLDYVTAIPGNLYGPGDRFDTRRSHVIPGLIHRMHAAHMRGDDFDVWGTGAALREFMHVDDAADALVHVLTRYHAPEPINIGSGDEHSIADVARVVADVIGFTGVLRFDPSVPDGMPRKLLDSSRLRALGWAGGRSLRDGIAQTYDWYVARHAQPAFDARTQEAVAR